MGFPQLTSREFSIAGIVILALLMVIFTGSKGCVRDDAPAPDNEPIQEQAEQNPSDIETEEVDGESGSVEDVIEPREYFKFSGSDKYAERNPNLLTDSTIAVIENDFSEYLGLMGAKEGASVSWTSDIEVYGGYFMFYFDVTDGEETATFKGVYYPESDTTDFTPYVPEEEPVEEEPVVEVVEDDPTECLIDDTEALSSVLPQKAASSLEDEFTKWCETKKYQKGLVVDISKTDKNTPNPKVGLNIITLVDGGGSSKAATGTYDSEKETWSFEADL